MITVNGVPRRFRTDLDTPLESKLREIIHEVEAAGAHSLLTDAIVLLQAAKDKVSDFVELEL